MQLTIKGDWEVPVPGVEVAHVKGGGVAVRRPGVPGPLRQYSDEVWQALLSQLLEGGSPDELLFAA